jgi:hypothetical protein
METATMTLHQTDTPAANSRSLKKIESQLLSLAKKASLLWQQMAALMIEVEEDGLWQGEAKSFTAWLKAMAEKIDLPESMLWRYLKAGRTYNALRASPDPELAALPPLGQAPCKAAPESLELLDKISQVAPPEEAADLAKTTLAGESDREALREAWQDYKTALPAADAELAETAPPESLAAGKALAGAMLQALRRSRGAFVAAGEPCHQWTLHSHVTVAACRFDAVCVELATPEQARPGLHGVRLAVEATALVAAWPEAAAWLEAAAYTDSLWLAVPAMLSQQAQALAPEWVGVMVYDAGRDPASRLQVARQASPQARHADLRGELALELLRRLL